MPILVTGGTGYIGSHTCTQLLEEGYEIIIVDNLSNSKGEVVDRIQKITKKKVKFYEDDLCNQSKLQMIFSENEIESVIHFAGLKAVGESVDSPLEYYNNNLVSTLNLLNCMKSYNVRNIIFSSSATVYGDTQAGRAPSNDCYPEFIPITEEFPLSITNPYGATKLMIEQMLKDIHHADPTMNIGILRYFNPVGSHASYLLGEDPKGMPNNLMPYILKVAAGELAYVNVYGADYQTKDGTGVRDYLHVMDLADGHIKVLESFAKNIGLAIYNLGTGIGYSVLDVIQCFEDTVGINIAYKIVGRRAGDIACCYANPAKAERELNWKANKTLADMCRDSWNWYKCQRTL
ncbi:MAG: UDP-glucose 4-epimerase GalE [Bacillota bacterium]